MLYALVLIVTTTSMQPVATGVVNDALGYAPVGGYAVTGPVTQTSQQIIGFYHTERGCLAANLKRNQNWPDFTPGQSVTGLCVQVEMAAAPEIIVGN